MTVNARAGKRGEAYERLLRQERLILDVTEALAGALEDGGVTRAELARRLGRTPGFVTQVLGGGRNLTLRTIADIAGALSRQPSFELSCEPKSESQWTHENWRWTLRTPRVERTDYPASSPMDAWRRAKLPVTQAAAWSAAMPAS